MSSTTEIIVCITCGGLLSLLGRLASDFGKFVDEIHTLNETLRTGMIAVGLCATNDDIRIRVIE